MRLLINTHNPCPLNPVNPQSLPLGSLTLAPLSSRKDRQTTMLIGLYFLLLAGTGIASGMYPPLGVRRSSLMYIS